MKKFVKTLALLPIILSIGMIPIGMQTASAESTSHFELGFLHGINTADAFSEYLENDCEAIVEQLDQEISRYAGYIQTEDDIPALTGIILGLHTAKSVMDCSTVQ